MWRKLSRLRGGLRGSGSLLEGQAGWIGDEVEGEGAEGEGDGGVVDAQADQAGADSVQVDDDLAARVSLFDVR